MNMIFLDQAFNNLFLIEACVREHTYLISNMIPCTYFILIIIPGVLIYSSLDLSAVLIEIMRSATYLSSDLHASKF